MEKVIEISALTKDYGKVKAVDNLSLSVNKGEIFGLLGPNGSGKTTTINCILSLIDYKGSIKIFDEEMNSNKNEIKSKIGVVFQDVGVFEELTVYENIDYFCGLYIKDKKTRKTYIEDAIKLTGLEKFKNFRPKELSGGLLRRLNIACGVAHKPELIFLDEPTVAVDPQSRNNILEGIKKLNRKGATIIYTTHYMEEVEQLCSRIVILDKGKIIKEGTKESLKESILVQEKISVWVKNITKEKLNGIRSLNGVLEVNREDNIINISYEKTQDNLENLIDYLKSNKIEYTKIFSSLPTLNDVFLELTGKELRD